METGRLVMETSVLSKIYKEWYGIRRNSKIHWLKLSKNNGIPKDN